MEAAQVTIDRWIDNKDVVCIYGGILAIKKVRSSFIFVVTILVDIFWHSFVQMATSNCEEQRQKRYIWEYSGGKIKRFVN